MIGKVFYRSKSALVVVLALLVASCTSVNHKVGAALNFDTDLKLEITVGSEINPDENNQSSPVFVRLYELNSTTVFDKADFIDLYERDEELLGATFVAKQELKRLIPNTLRTERFVLNKDTRYVALFAEFFRYKDATAKLVFPITSSNVVRNSIKININGNNITLSDKSRN